jgi:hypothetical protein
MTESMTKISYLVVNVVAYKNLLYIITLDYKYAFDFVSYKLLEMKLK